MSIWSHLLFFAADLEDQRDSAELFRAQGAAALERIGNEDDARVEYLRALAAELITERKYDEARSTGLEMRALGEKVYGHDSLPVASSLTALGAADEEQGREDDALADYGEALAIDRRVLGEAHPFVALVEWDVGSVHQTKLDFASAEKSYEHAVAVAEGALGADHPRVAMYLSDLAGVLDELGDYASALEAHRRALDIRTKTQGPDSPWALVSVSGIGQDYLGLGDYARAIEFLERAQKIDLTGYPTERAAAQFALARALAGVRQDPKRARQLAVDARDAYRQQPITPFRARQLAHIEAWLGT